MATRLTGFSKFLITLLIVGAIGGALYYFANKTETGQKLANQGKNGTRDSIVPFFTMSSLCTASARKRCYNRILSIICTNDAMYTA